MSAGQLVDNSQHQGSQPVDANSQRNCLNISSACRLVNFPNNYYDEAKLGAEIIIWLDQDSWSRSGEQLRDAIYSFDKNGIQTQ